MWMHDKIRDHKCTKCNYASSRKAHLVSHMKTVHDNIKDHKCTKCDDATTQKQYLLVHDKYVHHKIRDHKCNLCDYSTLFKGSLQVHVKAVHEKIKDHKCTKCDYESSYKKNLVLHKKHVHDKIRDHMCHLCGHAVSCQQTLKKHLAACLQSYQRVPSIDWRIIFRQMCSPNIPSLLYLYKEVNRNFKTTLRNIGVEWVWQSSHKHNFALTQSFGGHLTWHNFVRGIFWRRSRIISTTSWPLFTRATEKRVWNQPCLDLSWAKSVTRLLKTLSWLRFSWNVAPIQSSYAEFQGL